MSCKMCKGKRSIWKLLFGFIPWPVRCPSCGGRGWVSHPSQLQPAPRFDRAAPSRSVRSYSTSSPQAGPGLPLVVDPFFGDAPDIADPDPGGARDAKEDVSVEDVSADNASGGDASDQADTDQADTDQGTAY